MSPRCVATSRPVTRSCKSYDLARNGSTLQHKADKHLVGVTHTKVILLRIGELHALRDFYLGLNSSSYVDPDSCIMISIYWGLAPHSSHCAPARVPECPVLFPYIGDCLRAIPTRSPLPTDNMDRSCH